MRLVSFNAYRTLGLPGVTYVKPEHLFRHADLLRAADVVLFPASWQLNVLCYAWKKQVFPSPASYDLGFDKVEMTRSFQAIAEQHVPATLILPPVDSSVERVLDELGLPVVVKEPRNSMGRGVSLIESAAALRSWAARVDVLYAQQYLAIDGDVRVVLVGDRVLAAYWRRGGDGFRHNLALGAEAVFEDVPAAATRLVERIAPQLGIDHAGFDVALVDGHPYLFEFNVLFGNEALNRQGIRVEPAILDYLQRTLRPKDYPPLPLLPQAV
jgi:ribosomal protein S6--L-glutamate ligase